MVEEQQLKSGKDYVKITTIQLIKSHDLRFVPKKIEIVTDGIVLWKELPLNVTGICFSCGNYICSCSNKKIF